MENFNFDEWADLFKKDPAEFERQRKELLESIIESARPETRGKLRDIQSKCDSIRESHPPLESASIMSKMMIDNLFDLQDALVDITYLVNKDTVDADINRCYRKK